MKYVLLLLLTSSLVEAAPKLFIPTNPKPNAALFVVLHGCLSNAEESEKTTRMSEFAEQRGFYVYYPEPYLGEKVSKGCFEFYTESSQQVGGGDAAKIMDSVSSMIAQYGIDPQKIFVVGMSGGASLVSVLTSCYPDLISGAAIHSGMGYGLATNWQQSLLVAQTGPIGLIPRNQSCRPSDYKGKIMIIQGSRDMIMSPRHYDALMTDYLANVDNTTEIVLGGFGHYSYLHQKFYNHGEVVGQGIFVLGMNHEWSGYKSINPIGPLGPDVSQMMVDYFLDKAQ